ncbi:MAG: cell division protein ZapA [Prevotella sp.]|nr:cell division protein ZapA [Prevotella sp.]
MPEGNKERLHIRLHVYDEDIPVNINREEEELYRKAAKLATEIINRYASLYEGKKSNKELLYMSLIDIALRFVKMEKRNDVAPIVDILGKITSEIEDALGEKTDTK